MIANTDNYLLLKQLVVILETIRLKGEVVEKDSQRLITIESTLQSLNCTMEQIEVDFTIPYVLLNNNPVAMDLLVFVDSLKQLSGPGPHGTDLDALLAGINNPEGINNCIQKFPIMEQHFANHKENLTNGQCWGDTRQRAGELVDATSEALHSIRYWIENNQGRSLAQMLVLINMVEVVDRMFAFLNDYYGAENGNPE